MLAEQLRKGLGKPSLNLESKPQVVEAFNAAGVEIGIPRTPRSPFVRSRS